jgi:hypothetical protein
MQVVMWDADRASALRILYSISFTNCWNTRKMTLSALKLPRASGLLTV